MAAHPWLMVVPPEPQGDIDEDEVRRALQVLADPAHAVELRALPSGRSCVLPTTDLDGLVSAAHGLAGEKGVYLALNPVPPDVKRASNTNVIKRRWLFLDIDPMRPADTCATDQEKEAAVLLANRLQSYLEELGWTFPVEVDSGNGRYLLYEMDLPNTREVTQVCKSVLWNLARQFNTPQATIGVECHNAGRIARLPGSWNRKGPHSPERPHRPCKLLSVPRHEPPLTLEQLHRAAQLPIVSEAEKSPPLPAQSPTHPFQGVVTDQASLPRYVETALNAETGKVALASPGERNNTLNQAAFALGQLVGAGVVQRATVEQRLGEAATLAGLGIQEVQATLRSGLQAGIQEPRKLPASPSLTTSVTTTNPSGPSSPEIYTLPELLNLQLPDPRWAVAGLLSEGLSILAGKPKLGKSWMALNLALTIAGGGTALGSIEVAPGDVLYLSLEDRLRRVQDRARKLLAARCQETGIPLFQLSSRLHISVVWPRQHQGGLDELEKWLETAADPRLVIVDVWAKFRPPGKLGSAYEQDYDNASALKSITDKYHASLLALHHCKKAAADDVVDEISGTLGLAGAADGLLVLSRGRSEQEGKLFITGRDVEEQDLAVAFDPKAFVWTCLGDAARRSSGKVKKAILDIFRASPGSSYFANEMASLLDLDQDTVRKAMWRLVQQGELQRQGKKYIWPPADPPPEAEPDHVTNGAHTDEVVFD